MIRSKRCSKGSNQRIKYVKNVPVSHINQKLVTGSKTAPSVVKYTLTSYVISESSSPAHYQQGNLYDESPGCPFKNSSIYALVMFENGSDLTLISSFFARRIIYPKRRLLTL